MKVRPIPTLINQWGWLVREGSVCVTFSQSKSIAMKPGGPLIRLAQFVMKMSAMVQPFHATSYVSWGHKSQFTP